MLTGRISYAAVGYSGCGDGKSTNLRDFISDEMRSDWENNRDELLKFWASSEAVGGASVWRFLDRGLINSQLMSAFAVAAWGEAEIAFCDVVLAAQSSVLATCVVLP